MPAMSQYLQRVSNARLMVLLTLVMVVLAFLMVSPISPSAELMALANGQNVPDTQFWRTADAFYRQLEAYGSYGRQLYLTRVSPVDLFIPVAQAWFLAVAITLVFRAAFPPSRGWHGLNLLPFVAMVGDYLENISIVSLMLAYPTHFDALATLAAGFTAVKFIFSFVSIGCIAVGLLVWLVKRGQTKIPDPAVNIEKEEV